MKTRRRKGTARSVGRCVCWERPATSAEYVGNLWGHLTPRPIFPVVSSAIPGPQVSIHGIFEYIDATRSSTALRESLYVFPIVEGLHVVSLAFSVGLVVGFDLPLAGWILKGPAVSAVFRPVRPFLLTGFGITFGTGG